MGTLIALFVIHYIADFWFQTEKQATSKSSNLYQLAVHCTTYALPFAFFNPLFAVANGLLHFVTDYFTSKASGYYWNRGQTRRMFQVIGFDQLIHAICLIATAHYFGVL